MCNGVCPFYEQSDYHYKNILIISVVLTSFRAFTFAPNSNKVSIKSGRLRMARCNMRSLVY